MNDSRDRVTVIILTYNRPKFLPASLRSVLAQDFPGMSVYVFNNGGADGELIREAVDECAKQFPNRRCAYRGIKDNFGPEFYPTLESMCEGEWIVLFHDDDLMHPRYISTMMAELDRHPDAVQGGCGCIQTADPEHEPWFEGTPRFAVLDERGLAAVFISGGPHCFPSAIIKRDVFVDLWRPEKFLSFRDEYGKIGDRPYLLEAARCGKVVLLESPYINYRRHAGQVTVRYSTGPSEEQLLSLLALYGRVLTADSNGNDWRCYFNAFALQHLGSALTMNPAVKMTRRFRRKAIRMGALPWFEAGWMPRAIVKRLRRKYRRRCHLLGEKC